MTTDTAGTARTFRLPAEPSHVLDPPGSPLSGHYEAVFLTDAGDEVRRFLTDKGRTAILRMLADGTDRFDADALSEHTVEPDLEELLARMDAESGEGG